MFAADGTWTVYRGERKLYGNRAYRTDAAADPPAITLKYDADRQDGSGGPRHLQGGGDALTLCYTRSDIPAGRRRSRPSPARGST